MNTTLFSIAALAATLALVPMQGQAQTYTDNAGNSLYASGYNGLGASTPGFGVFNVATTMTGGGFAGTFTGTAVGSENGAEAGLDTGGKSFGFYANGTSGGAGDPSVTISRAFNVPTQSVGLGVTGDSFSLDFVTGYNDGGTSGVALTNSGGTVGSFFYQAGGAGFLFNGASTGQGYSNGILHLTYTLTSPTAYLFTSSGAVSYSGTGTFSSPITGFQVQQTNSAGSGGDHDGFFNTLSVTVPAAVPEASSSISLGLMLALGLGGLLLRRRLVNAE